MCSNVHMSSALHTIRSDTDMENLFRDLETEIEAREKHIIRLKQTMDTFQQKPELFDEKDVQVVAEVLQKRNEEFVKLRQDFTAAKELYQATVMELELKIKEKEDIIRQADTAFGSISSENELRMHFAQKQAQLQQGLQKAKAQLCTTIYERLRPSKTQ